MDPTDFVEVTLLQCVAVNSKVKPKLMRHDVKSGKPVNL